MAENERDRSPEERGKIFVRGASRQMGLVAVLLMATMGLVRAYGGVIHAHRSESAALVRIQVQTEEAMALLGERTALVLEIEQLLEARELLQPWLLDDAQLEGMEGRLEGICARSNVHYDGAAQMAGRDRGALDAVPYKVRFNGRRHQVPVLIEGMLGQEEALTATSLDLEVVNFVDDRVTGALVVEYPMLRATPGPDGQILRPFLVRTPASVAEGPLGTLTGPRRRALEEAERSLVALYGDLLEYQGLTFARAHLLAESRELRRLQEGRPAVQADVARVLPRVDRALTRSALGRAGFQAEPGGAVELVSWD